MQDRSLPRHLRCGDLEIDTFTHTVCRDGETIPLPKLTYRLLITLVTHAPKLLGAETLITLVWEGVSVSEETLKQRVKRLRKALGDASDAPRYVATVRGEGYRWIPEVSEMPKEETLVAKETLLPLEPVPVSLPMAEQAPRPLLRSRAVVVLAMVALVVLTFAVARLSQSSPPAVDNSNVLDHAVLAFPPIQVLGNHQSSSYFAEGLRSQFIQSLNHVEGLHVFPIESPGLTFQDELSLPSGTNRYRLEGEAHTREALLTGRFRLLEEESGDLVWEANLADPVGAWPNVQRAMSMQIAAILKLPLNQQFLQETENDTPREEPARDLYLAGMAAYQKYHHRDNEAAIRYFRKALELKPNYADAYAGLSMAHCQKAVRFGESLDILQEALNMARHALALDPDSPPGHKALGLVNMYLGFPDRALAQFEAAVKLEPTYADAMLDIAILMRHRGRPDEAAPWVYRAKQQAVAPEGTDRLLAGICGQLGMGHVADAYYRRALARKHDHVATRHHYSRFFLAEGNFSAARQQAELLVREYPNFRWSYLTIGDSYLYEGSPAEAETYYRRALELDERGDDFSYAEMRLKLMAWKNGEMDHERIEELLDYGLQNLEEDRHTPNMAFFLSLIYSVTEDNQKALYWLQKAIDQGWTNYRIAKKEPMLENLQAEDYFHDMIDGVERKVHLQRQRVLEEIPELESESTF